MDRATREGRRGKKARKLAWPAVGWLVGAEATYQEVLRRSDTANTPLARRTAWALGFLPRGA